MFELSAMAIFPIFAILWPIICDWLGLIPDDEDGP